MVYSKEKAEADNLQSLFCKIVHLMDWNPDYRYKLLGKTN